MRKATRDNIRWLKGQGARIISTAFTGTSHVECTFAHHGAVFLTRWSVNDSDPRARRNWQAQVIRLIAGGKNGPSRAQA